MNAQVMPGYKLTDAGVYPEDWLSCELGDLNPYVTSGSRGWAEYYSDRGDPFVRITNLSRSTIYIDQSDLKFVRLPTNDSEGLRTALADGDLLISITADIGIIGYVDSSLPKPSYINQHIALVRFSNHDIYSKYLSYFLAGERTQRLFRGSTDQGAKAGMNLAGIRAIKTVLPPIAEQRAIAAALSDMDALIKGLDQLIEKKRDIKQATMQQLLTGQRRLPGFSGEWVVKPIGESIDLLTGFPFPSESYSDSGVKLLRGSNVKRGQTDWSDEITQSWPCINQEIAKYEVKVGDLVISMDGSLVGKSYARIVESDLPALLLQRVARIRSKSIDIGYLTQFVGSPFFQVYCDSVKTVTAIPHISADDIRSFSIPIPPTLEEQTAIATILSDIDSELVSLEYRRDKASQIKQGMMQELLTGKTRIS